MCLMGGGGGVEATARPKIRQYKLGFMKATFRVFHSEQKNTERNLLNDRIILL